MDKFNKVSSVKAVGETSVSTKNAQPVNDFSDCNTVKDNFYSNSAAKAVQNEIETEKSFIEQKSTRNSGSASKANSKEITSDPENLDSSGWQPVQGKRRKERHIKTYENKNFPQKTNKGRFICPECRAVQRISRQPIPNKTLERKSAFRVHSKCINSNLVENKMDSAYKNSKSYSSNVSKSVYQNDKYAENPIKEKLYVSSAKLNSRESREKQWEDFVLSTEMPAKHSLECDATKCLKNNGAITKTFQHTQTFKQADKTSSFVPDMKEQNIHKNKESELKRKKNEVLESDATECLKDNGVITKTFKQADTTSSFVPDMKERNMHKNKESELKQKKNEVLESDATKCIKDNGAITKTSQHTQTFKKANNPSSFVKDMKEHNMHKNKESELKRKKNEVLESDATECLNDNGVITKTFKQGDTTSSFVTDMKEQNMHKNKESELKQKKNEVLQSDLLSLKKEIVSDKNCCQILKDESISQTNYFGYLQETLTSTNQCYKTKESLCPKVQINKEAKGNLTNEEIVNDKKTDVSDEYQHGSCRPQLKDVDIGKNLENELQYYRYDNCYLPCRPVTIYPLHPCIPNSTVGQHFGGYTDSGTSFKNVYNGEFLKENHCTEFPKNQEQYNTISADNKNGLENEKKDCPNSNGAIYNPANLNCAYMPFILSWCDHGMVHYQYYQYPSPVPCSCFVPNVQ